MLELVISWVAIALSAVILWRGVTQGILRTYQYFYAYVGATLIVSVSALLIYAGLPDIYQTVYWIGEFLTLILACGIVLEIFRHVLAPYPGPLRFARTSGISAFAIILIIFSVSPLLTTSTSMNGRMEDLEKNLRSIQALFLIAVIGLIAHYRIRPGKNMHGMIGGYAFATAASLLSIAADSYTQGRYTHTLGIVREVGYTLPFIVWSISLWAYSPSPENSKTAQMEIDYERFVLRTRRTIVSVRGYISRAAQP